MELSKLQVLCINLKKSTERRDRMKFRFSQLNVKNVEFIEAIDYASPLVDYYSKNVDNWYNSLQGSKNSYELFRKEVACYAAHFKALRRFLEIGDDWCMICEDDVLFHNEFEIKFNECMKVLPKYVNLVTFTAMMTKQPPSELINNFFINITKFIWGAQCYMLSSKLALEMLTQFDRPIVEIKSRDPTDSPKITSEIIIRKSNGYVTCPPLVIEDCIDSDRCEDDRTCHIEQFKCWNYKFYNKGDPEGKSPLKDFLI